MFIGKIVAAVLVASGQYASLSYLFRQGCFVFYTIFSFHLLTNIFYEDCRLYICGYYFDTQFFY